MQQRCEEKHGVGEQGLALDDGVEVVADGGEVEAAGPVVGEYRCGG
jgi:hypothetical protein